MVEVLTVKEDVHKMDMVELEVVGREVEVVGKHKHCSPYEGCLDCLQT